MVLTNAALYFIAATVLLKNVTVRDVPPLLWIAAVPVTLLAGVYGWLLFRGPVERDFEIHRRS